MPKYSHPPLHPSQASTLHMHTPGIILHSASALSYGQLGQEAFCQHHTGNHCGELGGGLGKQKGQSGVCVVKQVLWLRCHRY